MSAHPSDSKLQSAPIIALRPSVYKTLVPSRAWESQRNGVFLANITDAGLMERIAQETGARIGGKLYSDALTGDPGDGHQLYRSDPPQHEAVHSGVGELIGEPRRATWNCTSSPFATHPRFRFVDWRMSFSENRRPPIARLRHKGGDARLRGLML
jgi:hypothetical protein